MTLVQVTFDIKELDKAKLIEVLKGLGASVDESDIIECQSWLEFVDSLPDVDIPGFNDAVRSQIAQHWVQAGGNSNDTYTLEYLEFIDNPREYANEAYESITTFSYMETVKLLSLVIREALIELGEPLSPTGQ